MRENCGTSFYRVFPSIIVFMNYFRRPYFCHTYLLNFLFADTRWNAVEQRMCNAWHNEKPILTAETKLNIQLPALLSFKNAEIVWLPESYWPVELHILSLIILLNDTNCLAPTLKIWLEIVATRSNDCLLTLPIPTAYNSTPEENNPLAGLVTSSRDSPVARTTRTLLRPQRGLPLNR